MRAPWARAGLVAAAVIAADQLTKAWINATVDRGDRDNVFFIVDIVNVRNRGIAFGLLSEGRTLVIALTAAALLALLVFFLRNPHRPALWLATGLLFGGASGNLIDRVTGDAVTDFIDLPLWPAFNLADIAITVGVLVLLYAMESGRERSGSDDRDPDPA